ncbi:hypothetical protein [Pedobacter alpinus]|uniref:Leucine-rich repeat domain-containing protein n=1 Tax=Pedobacter alpinus TaxID=1590643 RepID=A0ABW5TLV1_9SPHI
MNYKVEFENGRYGLKAVIKTSWDDSLLIPLNDKNITDLEINSGKGWSGEHVDFLSLFPNLRSLTLIDFNIQSIEGIHYLKNLERLEVHTYSKTAVNFNSFPKLTDCAFEWIKGSESLFEKIGITSLFINSYKAKNATQFSKLCNLEELSILNSPIENLNGLSGLKSLRFLRLANLNKITSIDCIENFQGLEELEIEKCKGILSIAEIFKLLKLKRLLLLDMGGIKSIKDIRNLTELREFLFYESTNIIDGDLSSILELENLIKISFQNRKHYTHKRENFGDLYFG